jgi:phage-related protein
VFFREANGSVPVRRWLFEEVAKRDRRALAKIRARLNMLKRDGWNLRRPAADTLEHGIYELRAHFGRVQYRLLYFFADGPTAVVCHGITKEGKVPAADIALAASRRRAYESDPERHSYDEEAED